MLLVLIFLFKSFFSGCTDVGDSVCTACDGNGKGCYEKDSDCYYSGDSRINSSIYPSCTGSSCYDCKTVGDCEGSSGRTCVWDGDNRTCSLLCEGTVPNMSFVPTSFVSQSFNVLRNGGKTTNSNLGYISHVRVGTDISDTLRPDVPQTSADVTTTMRVLDYDCRTVQVEWEVVNTGEKDVTVAVRFWGVMEVGYNNFSYVLLPDMHGVGTTFFYIQSQESFSGIFASNPNFDSGVSDSFTFSTSVDRLSLNWNNVSLRAGKNHTFKAMFSNFVINYPTCSDSDDCSNCTGFDSCFSHGENCYYRDLICHDAIETPSCSGATCGDCGSVGECLDSNQRNCSLFVDTNFVSSCSSCATTCSTCLDSSSCTRWSVQCSWNVQSLPQSCYNLSSYCSGAYCSSCNSENSCRELNPSQCSYVGSTCRNTSCSSETPHLTSVYVGGYGGFGILLNGKDTTSDWYDSVVRVGGTDLVLLRLNEPHVSGDVTTTMRVSDMDCNTVAVEWEVVNSGGTDAAVMVGFYAKMNVTYNRETWDILPGNYGVYSVTAPFYIQSEEAFSGIATSESGSNFGSFIASFPAQVDRLYMNWNREVSAGGESHVFRLMFKNYLTSCLNPSSVCSECNGSELQCFKKNNYCFYSGFDFSCSNSSGVSTCESTSDCGLCQSAYDCLNVGSNCEWDRDLHLCNASSCTGEECFSCTTENGCYSKSDYCYYVESVCGDARVNPSCTESSCFDCKTVGDCEGSFDRTCVWNAVTRTCSLLCSGTAPNVSIAPSYYSFNVLLNNMKTTYNNSGYTSYVKVGTDILYSGLRPDMPQTSGNVTTTMRVLNFDCQKAEVEWEVVNMGGMDVTVAISFYGNMEVATYSNDRYTLLPDLHGLYTVVSSPFYIQSQEPFSGIFTSSDSSASLRFESGVSASFEYVNYLSLNWNNIIVKFEGGRRTLKATFSNNEIDYPTCTISDSCSDCAWFSSCYLHGEDCYYKDLTCYDAVESPSCTGEACGYCQTANECGDTNERTCIWSPDTNSCSSCSTTCSTCLDASSCTNWNVQCSWNARSLSQSCYNLSSYCSGTYCSSCNSESSCQELNSLQCSYVGTSCRKTSCDDTTPSVVSGSAENSFNIFVNGSGTTNWTSNVRIGTSTIPRALKPGVLLVDGGVMTTMSILDGDCHTVVVEWEVVNMGNTDATVAICFFSVNLFSGYNHVFGRLPSNHGLSAGNSPFYIESLNAPFDGIKTSYGPNFDSGVSSSFSYVNYLAFNWNGVVVSPGGGSHVFQVLFSNFECSADSHCTSLHSAGWTCTSGVCIPQCTADNAEITCNTSWTCVYGSCTECTAENEKTNCNSGWTCVSGSCAQCTTDNAITNCNFGWTCVSGICTPQCTTDNVESTCGSGWTCISGICTPQCTRDNVETTCGSGWTCVSGSCIPQCTVDNVATTCGSGWTCVSGSCIPQCTVDNAATTCGSEWTCVSGSCIPQCTMDNAGTVCNLGWTCITGSCIPQCTIDNVATTCGSGWTCVSGICIPECTVDNTATTCGSGWTCESGNCIPQCTIDNVATTCSPGWTCMSGSCTPQCTTEETCVAEHTTGWTCDSGLCKEPAGDSNSTPPKSKGGLVVAIVVPVVVVLVAAAVVTGVVVYLKVIRPNMSISNSNIGSTTESPPADHSSIYTTSGSTNELTIGPSDGEFSASSGADNTQGEDEVGKNNETVKNEVNDE